MMNSSHGGAPARRTARTPLRSIALGLSALLGLCHSASAQSFIDEANALYSDIVDERRSDPILLPALIALEEPPVGVDTPERAAIAFVGSRAWDAAEAWATAPPQQAMLDALRRGTRGSEYDTAMAFGQPYGVGGIEIDLIRGRAYTELGDPPLLADARHLYMDMLPALVCLVHVEATRLAGEGQFIEALDTLAAFAKFGYQMADREFLEEAAWGYRAMAGAIARIRDIAYVDFRGAKEIDPDELREIIARLHESEGPKRLDRLNFPRANRIAARQLIDVLYVDRGGVNEARFVPTMVRLATGDRPLRRFSAASYFEGLAGTQKDSFEIGDVNNELFESWERKWRLSRFDPVRALPFAWDQGVAGEDAIVVREGAGGDMGVLFELREIVELERVGTRQALGLLGRYYVAGSFATRIDGIRPRWVERLEDDPFNETRAGGREPPMRYFRPVTDYYLADERDEPQPHRMQVFPGDGTNFEVVLGEDHFLVYSTGADGRDNNGTRMHTDPESVLGDYLIWPPMLSLHREHLRQIGELD
jgi:hypothetical protein